MGCSPGERPELLGIAPLPVGFQRGMNLEPIGDDGRTLDLAELPGTITALNLLGVDHVAVVPSFFQPGLGDSEFMWMGSRERVEADTRAVIRRARAAGFGVLLKPHLWLHDRSDGSWRGDILPTAEGWDRWRANYRDAVLGFARIAAQEGAAGISIGSELTALALGRPEFWRELAVDVRAVFPGFVTYAANWDREVEAIQWWDAVDCVGVDAFWPLAYEPESVPSEAALQTRLDDVRERLQAVGRAAGRPVLITEIGYRSAVGAAYRPWEWYQDAPHTVDLELQRRIYRALARTFGPAAGDAPGSFAGTYLWVWYTAPSWGGPRNADFTPRDKPAARVLAAWFGAH